MIREEVVELEVSDDDILYYIDDEQGNEIGFAVLEDGKEVEYYYAQEEPLASKAVGKAVDTVLGGVHKIADENPYVTREQVADASRDLNNIYKQNAETVNALRGVGKDFKEFTSFLKDPVGLKTPPQTQEKVAEAAAAAVAATAPAPEPEPDFTPVELPDLDFTPMEVPASASNQPAPGVQ